jgi:hypothetical protein
MAFLALLDWILALHIVPRIRYLGFTTRGKKGPLTTTGDLSACKSKRTLIQLLTVNKNQSNDQQEEELEEATKVLELQDWSMEEEKFEDIEDIKLKSRKCPRWILNLWPKN